MNNKRDYQKDWEEYWKDVVYDPKGNINVEQIKKELSDYSFILEQASIVYCHITGEMLSHPLYYAKDVIAKADEYSERMAKEIIKDDIMSVINDNRLDNEEKLAWIENYLKG